MSLIEHIKSIFRKKQEEQKAKLTELLNQSPIGDAAEGVVTHYKCGGTVIGDRFTKDEPGTCLKCGHVFINEDDWFNTIENYGVTEG